MAMFVHLTIESGVPRILRNGISRLRKAWGSKPGGVYAMPVSRNFYASHQWLRELKRARNAPLAGVYFRIPDEQTVWIGHYGQAHRLVTAAEAIAQFSEADDPYGWEVVVPRRIEPKEIHKTRRLPQVIGWRYYPKAKGKLPCTCKYCGGGDYGSAKLRKRLGSPDDSIPQPDDPLEEQD